jgi:glycosyltransferase involved in cell wall biosynthesis
MKHRHVLFLIQSLGGGGAERVTANLANHWAETGWTVTIVTMAGLHEDVYNLDPRIRRIALDLARDSQSVMAGLWNNLRRVAAVRRTLRMERPDVALGIMSTASCLLALAGSTQNCVRIGTERIYPPMLPLGRAWEKVRERVYGNLDAVAALTSEGANWIKSHTNARLVPVIFNPVLLPLPIGEPVLRPEATLDPKRQVLLSVGRLSDQKAFDRLIRTFAQLAPEFPDWDLVIVGEGPLRLKLTALSQELGLAGRLHLPGRAGNIADWYRAADLFVLTSLFEGFPNVLAEAMAHGLPAVSVDCDTGPRDIISDGSDGLLVPQNNPEALVWALRRLMADDGLRREMGARAEQILDRLRLESIAGQWEELFTRCCESAQMQLKYQV